MVSASGELEDALGRVWVTSRRGYLFHSQNPGQPPIADEAEMHASSYKGKTDLLFTMGDMVSGLCQRRGFDSEDSQSLFSPKK